MGRFAYLAAERFGYLDKKGAYAVLSEQLKQEWGRSGMSDPLGKICLAKGLLTSKQVKEILQAQLMEPNISWGEDAHFTEMLNKEKAAKQTIGEYIGKRISDRPAGETIFLSNSSTIYYAFRGMVKHRTDVSVLTIHAAILAVYPSLKSRIRNVTTIWKGRVDLNDALIEPPDLNNPRTKEELNFLDGQVTHALISATGFDSAFGPMAENPVAREVSRRALQSGTRTCVLIDHTKIRVGTDKHEPALLFHEKEWNQIRARGDVEVMATCHPKMPEGQAGFKPTLRSAVEIESILKRRNTSSSVIKEVKKYHDWSRKLEFDILTEIPFGSNRAE